MSGQRQRASNGTGPVSERIHTGEAAEAVLRVLQDDRCRRILGRIDTEPRAADDLAEAAGVPLSTTYKKLEALVDGGLVGERTVVRDDGHHYNQYVRVVAGVDVFLGENGELRVVVSRRQGV